MSRSFEGTCLLKRAAAVAAAGACLTLSSAARAEVDLDSIDEAVLKEDLKAELDDVLALKNPPSTEDEMVEAFEYALGDEGDDDDPDPKERVITAKELADEMREAHTNLDDIVKQAVHSALNGSSSETWSAKAADRQGAALERLNKAFNGVLSGVFSAIRNFP